MYDKVPKIKNELEKNGLIITLPNNYEDPSKENRLKKEDFNKYANWKAEMFRLQENKVKSNDAVLVLNFEKDNQFNYIGGATFLEIFKAWELGKKIFLFNPIPEGILKDEIIGFNPTILNGNLTLIKNELD